MALCWYVGIAQPSREKIALRELGNQGFETYMPLCLIQRRNTIRTAPLLGRYLFIRIDTGDKNTRWRAVYNTRGIGAVISSGDKPQAVSDWIIAEIKSREVDGFVKLKPKDVCKFKEGESVRLRGSPLDAVFCEPVDDRRAAIFVSLLGKSFRQVVSMARLSSPIAQT